jgi:hypothetical protein
MRVDRLIKDASGVNYVLEYILTFMIASIIFSIMLMMANGLFIQGPASTVSKVQYTDIGNDLTAKIIDTYLLAPTLPDSGYVNTTFDMPNTVAGNSYWVTISNSSNPADKWDQEVYVNSTSNDISIKVTINGVNSTIKVNGSTSSSSPDHRIWYTS